MLEYTSTIKNGFTEIILAFDLNHSNQSKLSIRYCELLFNLMKFWSIDNSKMNVKTNFCFEDNNKER